MNSTEQKMHKALNVANRLIAKIGERSTFSFNDQRALRLMHDQSDVIVLWLAEYCTCAGCAEVMADAGLEAAR
jgi:hypothetical protein